MLPGDADNDFDVDLTDLATLLAHFGDETVTRFDGDFDVDGDVDLPDLAVLLSNYGTFDCPADFTPIVPDSDCTISVAGFDSGFYSSGDFKGEADDWVFDLMIELSDADDDWLGAGVKVTTANNATFRIVGGGGNPPVPGSGLPNRYRCFFSVPYAVANNNRYDAPFPTGGVIGAHNPFDDNPVYTSSELNANWYDFNSTSNDGPAAILRVVIDIGTVSGHAADAFGDVYFTVGSPGSGDIKVSDLTIAVHHLGGDGTPTTLTGAFYAVD